MKPFVLYALRVRGDTEARYIGQTYRSPEVRLMAHRSENCGPWRPRTAFGDWFRAHGDSIEAVELVRFATRQEAKAAERVAIRTAAALGHRLFNRDHVPSGLKAPKRAVAPSNDTLRCLALIGETNDNTLFGGR